MANNHAILAMQDEHQKDPSTLSASEILQLLEELSYPQRAALDHLLVDEMPG